MTFQVRLVVAAMLLLFAWKGSTLRLEWPPAPPAASVTTPQPSPEVLAYAAPVREYLPRMTPKDRLYMANFYEAMAFVLLRDGGRDEPIVTNTDKFIGFHGGSLRMAIDKGDVGKYGDLGAAIDRTFVNAVGADPKPLDADVRQKIVAACGALAWTFRIHGE